MSYIDLYTIYNSNYCLTPAVHAEDVVHEDVVDTYHSIERFVESGMIRSIGLNDFNITQLQRIISNATIQPVVYQFGFWPGVDQTEYMNFCRSHGIVMTDYGQRNFKSETTPKKIIDFLKLPEENLKFGKSVDQLYLRYTVSAFDSILSNISEFL